MEMYKRKMAITYFFTTISNFLEFFSSIHFPHPQTQFVFTVYNLVSCFFSLYITSYSFYPLFELFLNIVSDCIMFYYMAFPKFLHIPLVLPVFNVINRAVVTYLLWKKCHCSVSHSWPEFQKQNYLKALVKLLFEKSMIIHTKEVPEE